MRKSAWIVSQQQYALPRSVNPSRNNIESATIQLLSLVFGSAAVVLVADLGLDGVDALVMVTVVLVAVVVVVFNVEAAGFTAGSAPGCPAAGSVEPTGSPVPPPGTSFPSVSPSGAVAPSGSITTCAAVSSPTSATPPAPKAPPACITNRADTHHKRARPLRVGADGLARKAVKLQVVGIGPGPAEVRYTASRAPAVNQEIEGTLCGLHIASLPQIIV